MSPNLKKLDNPAWYALTEKHANFAQGTAGFKRYDPGIVLFSGFERGTRHIAKQFDEVIGIGDSFFLFDDYPVLPANYKIETVVQCVQMVCEKPVAVDITEDIIPLNVSNYEEMYQLVSEVFPGYYLPGTAVMGDYCGIFKEEKLVAIAGERLCMDGLTEISAVVTHPGHTGRRDAQQLCTYLANKNFQSGITPFLHTGHKNERAINIYELLGYTKRRIIPVTKIKRVALS
jgi:ribosomal protein S18 acetylase RimI-like enzyme